MSFPETFRRWGDAAAVERERHGFLWIGSMEADPRTPGGETLTWARRANGALYALDMVGEWVPMTDAEWVERWPHALVPPSVEGA